MCIRDRMTCIFKFSDLKGLLLSVSTYLYFKELLSTLNDLGLNVKNVNHLRKLWVTAIQFSIFPSNIFSNIVIHCYCYTYFDFFDIIVHFLNFSSLFHPLYSVLGITNFQCLLEFVMHHAVGDPQFQAE